MRFMVAFVIAVFAGEAWAQGHDNNPTGAGAAIQRGLSFLVKDARAWKMEHNCASCHHNLTGAPARQERGFGPWAAGALPWGTWYYPLLPTLDRQFPGKGDKKPLRKLNQLMRARVPDERLVVGEAGNAAKALRSWLNDLNLDTPENLNPLAVLELIACCAPLAPLSAALMTIVAAYTRSYREAQTYVGLILLVPTFPLIFASTLGLRPTAWLMIIPSLSQHFMVIGLLRAEPVSAGYALLSVSVSLALGALAAFAAGRLYHREALLG